MISCVFVSVVVESNVFEKYRDGQESCASLQLFFLS